MGRKKKLKLYELKIEENPTDIYSLSEEAFLDFVMTLWEAMQKNGISKKELAKRVGVSVKRVSEVLGAGKTNNLGIQTMVKYLVAVGLKLKISAEKIRENKGKGR